MAHLNSISIDNFRVFKTQTFFEFARFNLFTGPNNSGKSSLFKFLLLLQQNLTPESFPSVLNFDSNSLKLGEIKSFSSSENRSDIIFSTSCKWVFGVDGNFDNWIIEMTYTIDEDNNSIVLSKIMFYEPKSKTTLFEIKYENSFDRLNNPKKLFIPYINLNFIIKKNQLRSSVPSVIIPETDYDTIDNFRFSEDNRNLLDKGYYESRDFSELNKSIYSRKLNLNLNQYDEGYERLINSDIPITNFKSPIFKYSYNEKDNESAIEQIKIIEQLVISNISNDMLEFIADNEFLNELGSISKKLGWAIFGYSDNKFEFKPNVYGFSVYKNKLFELMLFEVLYQIKKNSIANKVIKVDIEKYSRSNITQDPYKSYWQEIRGEIIPNEIAKIEQFIWEILSLSNQFLFESLRKDNMSYLPANRSFVSRMYSQIDNNPYFFNILKEYKKIEQSLGKNQEAFLSNWIKELGIGEKFKIETIEIGYYSVVITKDNKNYNIADIGYGISQLLPVLMQIVISARKSQYTPRSDFYKRNILLIEEPESNLHPNLQSKLVEMLIDATDKFNIQFFIETHSEYLIRKLQVLTAKKVIKSSDTAIFYFNPKQKGQGIDVKRIAIQEDGRLSQPFPPGFYDEAIRLMLSIFEDEGLN